MKLDDIEIPVKFYISITTSINGSTIEHVVNTVTRNGYSDTVKYTMDAAAEETKKALISLGWTPPNDED